MENLNFIPKISMVTIAYNSEKTLHRTIETVISQDYPNLEYIIIDGGSKDSTVDIIKEYGNSISKWVSETDKGISNAFNKGIKMATGEIIGIINSDDGLQPGALIAIAKAYEKNVEVYRGKVLLWKEDTDTKVIETPSMHFDYSGLNKISHQSTFIAKKAYEKYGAYDETCHYMMDYDLLLRFERAGAKFKFVDDVLAFYTLGGLTFTGMNKQRMNENIKVIKQNGANSFEVFKFCIIKAMKELIKKILSKETLMKIRNR